MSTQRLNIQESSIAEQVWLLQHAAYRCEADLIGVSDLPPLRDTIQALQACGETFFGFLAEDGELAGAIAVQPEPDGAVAICRMMVHPDYNRQGIGSELLRHAFAQYPAGQTFTVTAEIRNVPAVRLYEKHGFVRGNVIRPSPNITMIRLVKTTAPA